MTVYNTGHVKRDPLTGTTATRTVFSEDNPALASRAWSVCSPKPPVGPRWAGTAEVDGWDDLYTPPPEDES